MGEFIKEETALIKNIFSVRYSDKYQKQLYFCQQFCRVQGIPMIGAF